ncbi:hypothetical protein AK812_SmicGene13799 [Symbiodinium microadriaticum]|uniref:Fe2OG dioxygenase domain-containing protein n=1 Tax=Symbiodinium microadriaticum TaxID=2951 RepID=A0A1Q9E762_SYMMI|nr:hypothetical protein AK812_SmicGene13799 [Symbiodinium microadriaticum]
MMIIPLLDTFDLSRVTKSRINIRGGAGSEGSTSKLTLAVWPEPSQYFPLPLPLFALGRLASFAAPDWAFPPKYARVRLDVVGQRRLHNKLPLRVEQQSFYESRWTDPRGSFPQSCPQAQYTTPLPRAPNLSFSQMVPTLNPWSHAGNLLAALRQMGAVYITDDGLGCLPRQSFGRWRDLWYEALFYPAAYRRKQAARAWQLRFSQGEDLQRTLEGHQKSHTPDVRYNFGLGVESLHWCNWGDLQWVCDELCNSFAVISRLIFNELTSAVPLADEPPKTLGSLLYHGVEQFAGSRMRHSIYPSNGSCTEHTDYGVGTFQQSTAAGLQARLPNGQWLPLQPPDSGGLLFAGDMLERMTNGQGIRWCGHCGLSAPATICLQYATATGTRAKPAWRLIDETKPPSSKRGLSADPSWRLSLDWSRRTSAFEGRTGWLESAAALPPSPARLGADLPGAAGELGGRVFCRELGQLILALREGGFEDAAAWLSGLSGLEDPPVPPLPPPLVAKLKLNVNEVIAREASRTVPDSTPVVKAIFFVLSWSLDRLYDARPIQKFWRSSNLEFLSGARAMGGLRQSYSEPTLPNRSLLQGGHAVLHRHADFETQRKVLQHYRRLDGVKPSVHREQQERDFQKHRRLLQIRQRFPLKPLPGQQDGRQNPSRRGFERKLEQMLLQDWDGAEKEFAWQQHVTTRVLPALEAASTTPGADLTSGSAAPEKAADSREGHLEPSSAAAGSSPAPDASLAVQEDAGTTGAAESLEVPSSTQIGGSGGSETVSRHVAQGGAVGGGHVSSAGPPGVDALAGNVGNGGPDGGGRMGPPDFRSILQADGRPAAGAPADMAMPSVTPAVGTVMGGSDVVSGSPFAGGQVQPANAGMGSANAQNIPMPEIGLAPKPSNPISDTAISPEPAPAANFGGGGLGGGRRMRPPDFRSILQGDDGPAGGTSANMAMPSVTPAVGTVMGGNDVVNGSPFAPTSSAMGSRLGGPIGTAGADSKSRPGPTSGFDGGGQMRPPDFRNILQGDDLPASSRLGQGLPASNGAFGNGGLPDSPGIAHASAADIQTTAMAELQAPQLSGDPKPAESRDPFGLEDLSGGYVPSAASAPRRRRPRAGQL